MKKAQVIILTVLSFVDFSTKRVNIPFQYVSLNWF